MDRRAYFFVIDAIMALLVMTIGIILIFSSHSFRPLKEQASQTSSDVMGIMNIKVRDLNNDYCGINSYLTRNGNITDYDNTMIEQVAEFYYRNKTKNCVFCDTLARNVISNLTWNVPPDFHFLVRIDGVVMYHRNQTPIGMATKVVPTRKIVQSLYDSDELAGPYIAEVLVWQ